MKGIILAGGSGSRLAPLTSVTSKQLLPVYDKPMIYYPLSTLMDLGIKEILIISTPRDLPNIQKLLGDGSRIGLKLQYHVQDKPEGIAQGFLIAGDFIDQDICFILGDNLFYLGSELAEMRKLASQEKLNNAAIVLCPVKDPERFGVADCDEAGKVVRIIEKPKVPTSNLAVTGLYFYPRDVLEKAKTLTPSARGELEITDLNNEYLEEGRLMSLRLSPKSNWLDAGTPDSLLAASQLAAKAYHDDRNPFGYIEAMAHRRGMISKEDLDRIINGFKSGTPYAQHLRVLSVPRDKA
jgi:glucose-1-phosphate thymidylyltransferase